MPGDVTSYAVSGEGGRIVAAQVSEPAAEGYMLMLIDLNTGEKRSLVGNLPCLLEYDVSPDGQWLAYLADDWDAGAQTCASQTYYGPKAGMVYVMSLSGTEAPSPIAYCGTELPDGLNESERADLSAGGSCLTVGWAPDSQRVFWINAEGVWLSDRTAITPRLAGPTPIDPEGYAHWYVSGTWSGSGRYMLLRSFDTLHDSRRESVLDVEVGQEIPLPYMFSYPVGPRAYTSWIRDDRLFIVNEGPRLEVWQPVPEEGQFVLESSTTLAITQYEDAPYLLMAPAQLDNGLLSVAVVNPYPYDDERSESRGLYLIDPLSESSYRALVLPPLMGGYAGQIGVAWSRDDNSAIIEYWGYGPPWEHPVYYASISEGILYAWASLYAYEGHDFLWVPQNERLSFPPTGG